MPKHLLLDGKLHQTTWKNHAKQEGKTMPTQIEKPCPTRWKNYANPDGKTMPNKMEKLYQTRAQLQ